MTMSDASSRLQTDESRFGETPSTMHAGWAEKGEKTMFRNPLKRIRWFAVGLIVGVVAMSTATADMTSATLVDVDQLELPMRGEGPGHGNYCLIPAKGAYFYGRDLQKEVETYAAFAAWCQRDGGKVRWTE